MARRILFVEQTNIARDPDKELFVDAWVEVDWKVRMALDDWTGEAAFAPPTYKVRPIERYPSEFNEYGMISDAEEVAWLAKAMTKPRGDHSYEATKIIARVNELGVKNAEGHRGFKIEVMTGHDASSFIAAEKRDQLTSFAKSHWWQIGLGLLALWWWLS